MSLVIAFFGLAWGLCAITWLYDTGAARGWWP